MRHSVKLLLSLILFIPYSVFAQAPIQKDSTKAFDPADAYYLWPTNADIYLSASFGETRFSHFHAGLDVKTWGKEGYEVYATRDGILHRLGVSPYGYGNVVYLKHDDGSYSVYGHLKKFIPKLEAVADSIRMSNYAYRFNQNVEELNIRFKQGDIIAYTGSSGAGPAHLHYELRTPTESPFNPLLTNINVMDNRKPKISAISIEPLSLDSKVRSRSYRLIRRPNVENGEYDFGKVSVKGPVGISADMLDYADKVFNVYAVYKIQMFVDDSLYFEAKADSFSYPQTPMVKIDRVYELLNTKRKGYQKFYLSDGNTLPFYTFLNDSKGVLDLEPGTYNIKLRAFDYAGNKADGKLKLRFYPKEEKTIQSFANFDRDLIKFDKSWSAETFKAWKWTKNEIIPNLSAGEQLGCLGYKDGFLSFSSNITGNNRLYINQYDSLVVIGPKEQEMKIYRVLPIEPRSIQSYSGRFKLNLPRSTVVDTMPLVFWEDVAKNTVHIFPDVYPFIEGYSMSFTDSTLAEHDRFYQLIRNRSDFVGGEIENQTLSAKFTFGGVYTIEAEHTPPTASSPGYYRRKRDGKLLPGVLIKDNKSGVDLASIQIYLNGERGIPVFNPDRGALMYYNPTIRISRSKTNKLEIIFSDLSGNERSSTFEF